MRPLKFGLFTHLWSSICWPVSLKSHLFLTDSKNYSVNEVGLVVLMYELKSRKFVHSPKVALFIRLKNSLWKSDVDLCRSTVFLKIYNLNHVDCENLIPWWIFVMGRLCLRADFKYMQWMAYQFMLCAVHTNFGMPHGEVHNLFGKKG